MLKTRQGTSKNCAKLQRYLRKDGRSLASDFSNVIGDPENWGREMDETRAFAGKDFGRRYYHFILSPDPKDDVDLQTMRDIALAWARENYPDRQWAIEYHDDNKSGVLHAHVVLNAYDCTTGRKVHRSDAKCRREARVLNRLKAERGLTVMPDVAEVERAAARERKLTGAELEMRSRGLVPYKDKLCDAIDRFAPLSADFAQFRSALATVGIEVYVNKRGQYVFVPPEHWHGYPCKDVKLGAAYARSRIVASFSPDLGRSLEVAPSLAKPDFRLPPNRLATYADVIEKRARGYRQIRVDRLASAVRTLRAEKVCSLADLDGRIAEASSSIAGAEASVAALEDAYAAVRASFADVETLARYEKVWSAYGDAPKRGKAEIEARYPDAVKACAEAQARLEDRGIETPEARARIEGLCYEGLSRVEAAKAGLGRAKETLGALRNARRTVEAANAYRRLDAGFRKPRAAQRTQRAAPARPRGEKPLPSLRREARVEGIGAGGDMRERKLALDLSRAEALARDEAARNETIERTNDKER